MSSSEIVSKVWNYAHVLRDEGIGNGDYVEQITCLIFLKMADEREKAGIPLHQTTRIGEEPLPQSAASHPHPTLPLERAFLKSFEFCS